MKTVSSERIYLDYNASGRLLPEAKAAMNMLIEALSVSAASNASSVHTSGRTARGYIEQARQQVAALVGARARDVVFTSGATEANNAVLRGAGAASLLIAASEHECVHAAAKASGLPVTVIPVNQHGGLVLAALEAALAEAPAPALLSVMSANNETGVLQPIAAIAALGKRYGARMHSDVVQSAGRQTLDINALGLDYAVLSAHKIGGPAGIGAIVLRGDAPLAPLITGGGQELGRRSGTENTIGIAGFGAAATAALAGLQAQPRIAALRDRMEAELRQRVPDLTIAGAGAPRLANTSAVVMPGVRGEIQVMHFDLAGIAVSSGSACSSGKVKASHVLEAMGFSAEDAGCSLRVSLGASTTDADIDAFVAAWCALYARSGRRAA